MANNVAPDSWEQQADNADTNASQDKSIESKFSTLNVNAAEFVPSFCINSTTQNAQSADNVAAAKVDTAPETSIPPDTHHGLLLKHF